MNSNEKYSLLLMRDGGSPIRWRISRRFFRALCITAVLLPLLLGGAGWLAWILYKLNTELSAQQHELKQENKTLNAALQRLSNIEHLLALPENAKLLAVQHQQAQLNAAAQSTASLEALQVPPQENVKEQSEGDAISLDTAESPQLSSEPSVDMRLVGVENVHIRRQGDSLRIALDLHNSQQRTQLAGYVSCLIKDEVGENILLEVPRDVASFRINRFKRAILAPALPAAVRSLPALTVTIEVHLDERGVVYRNEYPVEQ